MRARRATIQPSRVARSDDGGSAAMTSGSAGIASNGLLSFPTPTRCFVNHTFY
jgi:hypothetical protein